MGDFMHGWVLRDAAVLLNGCCLLERFWSIATAVFRI